MPLKTESRIPFTSWVKWEWCFAWSFQAQFLFPRRRFSLNLMSSMRTNEFQAHQRQTATPTPTIKSTFLYIYDFVAFIINKRLKKHTHKGQHCRCRTALLSVVASVLLELLELLVVLLVFMWMKTDVIVAHLLHIGKRTSTFDGWMNWNYSNI